MPRLYPISVPQLTENRPMFVLTHSKTKGSTGANISPAAVR
jgi:hypothetical protein